MKQDELLDRIAADDVTYQHRGRAGTSYRLWSSEHEYTTVTKAVARLVDAGLAERYEGYLFHRGGVRLTGAGREARRG